MNLRWYTCAFPSNQQAIVRGKVEFGVRRVGLCGQENDTSTGFFEEALPGYVTRHIDAFKVIHSGAAKTFVVQDEATGLDYIHCQPGAGGEAQECPGILRYIGLKERKTH